MNDQSLLNKLDTEEGKQKAESLFSRKFIEYLTSKKSSIVVKKPSARSYNSYSKDVSESSDETTTSESSKKSVKRGKKNSKDTQGYWGFQYRLRNKLTQCSLLKNEEEVVLPEEIRPLLLNMTIILQEFKQSRSEFDDLYSLISRITMLMTEFNRRPLKKIQGDTIGNYSKSLRKTVEGLMTLLDDYKTGPVLEPDNEVREYKRILKHLAAKNLEIASLKKRILEEELKVDPKAKDITERVRNSILANEKLRCEIKFNHNQMKKYKKILIEKEWAKHKIETELSHLKRKSPKVEFFDDCVEKLPNLPEPISDKKWPMKKSLLNSRRMKGKKTREKSKLDKKTK